LQLFRIEEHGCIHHMYQFAGLAFDIAEMGGD
jgi:hypothetical protein